MKTKKKLPKKLPKNIKLMPIGKDGKEFDEVVIANNKKDAIEVALQNNPEAVVLNSDWTFKL